MPKCHALVRNGNAFPCRLFSPPAGHGDEHAVFLALFAQGHRVAAACIAASEHDLVVMPLHLRALGQLGVGVEHPVEIGIAAQGDAGVGHGLVARFRRFRGRAHGQTCQARRRDAFAAAGTAAQFRIRQQQMQQAGGKAGRHVARLPAGLVGARRDVLHRGDALPLFRRRLPQHGRQLPRPHEQRRGRFILRARWYKQGQHGVRGRQAGGRGVADGGLAMAVDEAQGQQLALRVEQHGGALRTVLAGVDGGQHRTSVGQHGAPDVMQRTHAVEYLQRDQGIALRIVAPRITEQPEDVGADLRMLVQAERRRRHGHGGGHEGGVFGRNGLCHAGKRQAQGGAQRQHAESGVSSGIQWLSLSRRQAGPVVGMRGPRS